MSELRRNLCSIQRKQEEPSVVASSARKCNNNDEKLRETKKEVTTEVEKSTLARCSRMFSHVIIIINLTITKLRVVGECSRNMYIAVSP